MPKQSKELQKAVNFLLRQLIKYDEEIMMNDDNLESNLLTSSLLKKTSGLHAGTS